MTVNIPKNVQVVYLPARLYALTTIFLETFVSKRPKYYEI